MNRVEQAIERAGLLEVLRARERGDLDAVRESVASWRGADLLALGALADRIRREEVGDVVRFVLPSSGRADDAGVHVAKGENAGLDFLRAVAIARITAEKGSNVRIDWDDAGFELAQVALGFGANEIRGALANKRGLPIHEEDVKKVKGEGMVSLQALKKRELEKILACVGRTVVFEGAS
jgi:2-iminoacetate synthase ThiH